MDNISVWTGRMVTIFVFKTKAQVFYSSVRPKNKTFWSNIHNLLLQTKFNRFDTLLKVAWL